MIHCYTGINNGVIFATTTYFIPWSSTILGFAGLYPCVYSMGEPKAIWPTMVHNFTYNRPLNRSLFFWSLFGTWSISSSRSLFLVCLYILHVHSPELWHFNITFAPTHVHKPVLLAVSDGGFNESEQCIYIPHSGRTQSAWIEESLARWTTTTRRSTISSGEERDGTQTWPPGSVQLTLVTVQPLQGGSLNQSWH